MKKYCFLLLTCTLLFGNVIAQRREVKALSSEKRHEMAEKLIKQGGYYAAIDHMKELVEKHPDNETYLFKLAEAYFHSRDYTNAEKYYATLAETKDLKKKKKSSVVSVATFHYGESLKYNAKYEQAREVFGIFANSNFRDVKGESYKVWAKNEVLSCEYALSNKDRAKFVEVLNIDSNINAAYSDFSPRLKNDSVLVYSSIQEDSVISVRHGDKHFEHTKIFTSTYKDSSWQLPVEQPVVNSIFEHSGNGSYSSDGKRFYFTRCRPINGKMKCQIYVSNISSDSIFSKPKKLAGHANHSGHTCTQPFSAKVKSGKADQEILFFVSDMKGTNGGMDIWYSMIDKEGKSGKPVNCGRSINTPRDEVAPSYDVTNNILYFSSNYHYGFGGFDIFRATGSQNKYGKPENMSKPINSNLDDTYYTQLKGDKYKGFLVSNRPGGMALLSATCCDDIYSFKYRQPTIVVMNVTDSATGKKLEDVKLVVKSTQYVNLPDSILFNTNSEVMDKMELETDPTFLENLRLTDNPKEFFVLEPNNIIQVSADKPNFNSSRSLIRTDKQGIIDSLHVQDGVFSKAGSSPRFVTINVVMGKEKAKLVTAPAVKVDTAKVASSLKDEFAKVKKVEVAEVKQEAAKAVVTPETKIQQFEFALNLQFQYNKSDLVEGHLTKLDSIVTILQSKPKMKLEFSTHTDAIGSDEYNMKLSYRRAEYIANYIISKGISQKRVKGIGLGETKHVAPNEKSDGSDHPEGRQENRRTEVKLISGL